MINYWGHFFNLWCTTVCYEFSFQHHINKAFGANLVYLSSTNLHDVW